MVAIIALIGAARRQTISSLSLWASSVDNWEPSDKRFAMVGAITLFWNEVEHLVDSFLCHGLLIPKAMWNDVETRIGGFESKAHIVRTKLRRDLTDKHLVYQAIAQTLGAATELKPHRDHIAHASPAFEVNLATTKQRREVKTLLMKPKYLRQVVLFADALVEECMAVEDVFIILYGSDLDEDWPHPDALCPDTQSLKPRLEEALLLIRARARVRIALGPLPKFSDPDAKKPASEPGRRRRVPIRPQPKGSS